jgi:hypothetical protein
MLPNKMNILFLTHSDPNYVPDFLLHGLRKLLGENVVDYPKKECLYSGMQSGNIPEIYRDPFWFPADNGKVNRDDIESRLKNNYFDYVVCDVRAQPLYQSIYDKLSGFEVKLVVIDGEDSPVEIKPGPFVVCRRESDGTDYSIPLPMALPEEIFNRIVSYSDNPKSHSIGFIGSVGKYLESRSILLGNLASYYPDSLLLSAPVSYDADVHSEERVGLDSYYDNLQRCRFVLTLRGKGYDTFRFWENTACNALHISEGMPLFIPNDFKDKLHIIRYSNIDQLRSIIDNQLEREQETTQMIQNSHQHLKEFHLTTSRATYFLDRIKSAFN